MHTQCGGAGAICGGAVTHAVGTVQFTETRTRDSRAKQRTTVYCCPQYGGNSLPPAPFGRMCPPRCSMGNSPPACIRGTSRVNLRPMCHPHHVSQVPSPSPRHKSSAPLPCPPLPRHNRRPGFADCTELWGGLCSEEAVTLAPGRQVHLCGPHACLCCPPPALSPLRGYPWGNVRAGKLQMKFGRRSGEDRAIFGRYSDEVRPKYRGSSGGRVE